MTSDRAYHYFDHNATTPPAPSVVEVVAKTLASEFGNANSTHRLGVTARYTVEKSRRALAKILNVSDPSSLIFTDGGSEANNLALRGAAFAARRAGRGNHIITTAAEHKAVIDTAKALRDNHGFDLTILPVDEFARPRANDLKAALRPETILVSLMWANNEVGSISPIAEFVRIVKTHSNALFHTDAVQAVGRLPIDLEAVAVDLLTMSAHKLYGPKGVGALFVRPVVVLEPIVTGGGQEAGLRAGTENTAGIAGLGEAVRLAKESMEAEASRLIELREQLWQGIAAAQPDAIRNSPKEDCLPGTLHISVRGVDSRKLVAALDKRGFACSSGSACTSTGTEVSHVLDAMGADHERAAGSLRLSLGRGTTDKAIAAFPAALAESTAELRANASSE